MAARHAAETGEPRRQTPLPRRLPLSGTTRPPHPKGLRQSSSLNDDRWTVRGPPRRQSAVCRRRRASEPKELVSSKTSTVEPGCAELETVNAHPGPAVVRGRGDRGSRRSRLPRALGRFRSLAEGAYCSQHALATSGVSRRARRCGSCRWTCALRRRRRSADLRRTASPAMRSPSVEPPEPGTTIELYEDGVSRGTLAASNGTWTRQLSGVGTGTYSACASDFAGRVSAPSVAHPLLIVS